MSRASEARDKERDDIGTALDIVRKLIQSSTLPEWKADHAILLVRILDDFIYNTYTMEMP